MSKHLAIAVLLSAVVCMAKTSIADDRSSKFSITTKRSEDNVEVETGNEKAIFSIHSPFGISNAVIERIDDKWPDAVTLRFHLKGLENLRLTNGKVTLEASVLSHDAKSSVRLWMDKNEDAPLDTTSPFWMEIRMFGSDGNPATQIPLKDGYFEMKFPKAFFDDNPKSITISWIDFYRR